MDEAIDAVIHRVNKEAEEAELMKFSHLIQVSTYKKLLWTSDFKKVTLKCWDSSVPTEWLLIVLYRSLIAIWSY